MQASMIQIIQSMIVQLGMVCSFLAGMICVLAGVFYNAVEARRGFEVIRIEADQDVFDQED
jgi:hypothetical protein